MADWNEPELDTPYVDFLDEMKDRDDDAVTMCNTAPTNPFDRMMRWVRSTATTGKFQEYLTGAWADRLLTLAGGGTGAANASDARTNLGLGTIATQDANNVTITGGSIAASLFAALYPVGSLYFQGAVATNPGTLLGFGTWVAHGAGRVLVGLDAGQTEFDTLNETGGSKTHTLATSEIPAHVHTGPAHTHTVPLGTDEAGSTAISAVKTSNTADTATTSSAGTGNTGSEGGGGAHNNLQPYVVCYIWRRTA